MRSFLGARPLFAVALISLVLIAGMGGPGALVFAQQSETPVAGQEAEPPASGSISEEEPSAELPTDVPAPPTEVPLPPTEAPLPPTEAPPPPIEPVVLEPTAPIELPATDEPIVPAAEDTTLYVDPGVCSPGLYYWQVFVTMDGPEFPATATLTFDNGDTATVPYNQSSYINGRYYGYFQWSGNQSEYLVSITGAFPAELNPSVESVSGPNCGPATVTATATATTANTETATVTNTATATGTATSTPTVANITLDAATATCYTGLSYWQVFVTMDGPEFPATATLTFDNGDTAVVPYNQSSYIGGRYYGYFEWIGNVSDYLVSVSGAFPAELNPSVESVSGPNCGPATATATATTANTETATATGTATGTPSNTPVASATATAGPMVVTRTNVNCRTGGGTSFSSLGVVARNTSLPLRGAEVNGWIPVVCFEQDGWIISDQLNPGPVATATVPSGSTELRSGDGHRDGDRDGDHSEH
ncbi:MAG: hypothetical protein M9947_16185 [Thermomicrobiales bacterium]|nr:hypothetical protein [Thermomicrobiales bacterium]